MNFSWSNDNGLNIGIEGQYGTEHHLDHPCESCTPEDINLLGLLHFHVNFSLTHLSEECNLVESSRNLSSFFALKFSCEIAGINR